MTGRKTLKLLLVEDELENEPLLCQALMEVEENRQWCNWRSTRIVHVEQLPDALDYLRSESFDLILLNLSLPDSPAVVDSFRDAKAQARGAPIVILADQEDGNLANYLLREGAQDVLLKSDLEGTALAHSMRYSIERQHRATALLASPFQDDLTGTLTRQGFLTIAEHYVRLARHSRKTLFMASIDFADIPHMTQEERDARDLVLIRAAEILRGVFDAPSLLSRVGPCRFGLIVVGLDGISVEAVLNRAVASLEETFAGGGQEPRIHYSVAELDPGTSPEELLGEDGQELAARAHRRTKTAMLAD